MQYHVRIVKEFLKLLETVTLLSGINRSRNPLGFSVFADFPLAQSATSTRVVQSVKYMSRKTSMSSQTREVAIIIRMTWYFRRFETRVKSTGFIVILPKIIDELLIYCNMLICIKNICMIISKAM